MSEDRIVRTLEQSLRRLVTNVAISNVWNTALLALILWRVW